VQAALLLGDFATAESTWHEQWEDSRLATAWDRWVVASRLAATRAEMVLAMGRMDDAIDWARKAIELCIPVHRVKYEIVGRIVLGQALLASGKATDALADLKLAVEQADRLDNPLLRWRARGALGKSFYGIGDDGGAERAFTEASTIIQEVASGLAAERSTRYLDAEPVREVLGGVTNPRP
jgi:tetratricopeptide (TPR) repeat protein